MNTPEINMKGLTPILRIFDEAKAKEFYLDFLGFVMDWEHRFEANMPLYMQISNKNCIIHLSEHHGDCCPGAAVRIEVGNIELFHTTLLAKEYKYARPGIEETPWNTKELCIHDPFGIELYSLRPSPLGEKLEEFFVRTIFLCSGICLS